MNAGKSSSQQLLDYLDEVDEDVAGYAAPAPLPPAKERVVAATAAPRYWAWDSVEEEGEEGQEEKDEGFLPARAPLAAESAFLGDEGEDGGVRKRREALAMRKKKVARLRLLLKERQAEVDALKKSWERLKMENDKREAKRAVRLAAKLAKEKEERSTVLNRQYSFAKQLEGDVATLESKCEELRRVLESWHRQHEQNVKLARNEGNRRLRSSREQWSAAEKRRLEKLAMEKKAVMQDSAIRVLEPELQRLVQTHRTEIEKRRSAMEAAEESLGASISVKMAERKSQEIERALRDAQSEIENSRLENSRLERQAQHRGEKELAALRESMRRSMESDRVTYEARLARQREGAAARLESARALSISSLQEEEAAAAAEAQAEERHTVRAIERLMAELEDETVLLEEEAARAGRKEGELQAQALAKGARDKADSEAKMVIDKLRREAAAQRKELERECEEKLEEANSAGSRTIEILREEEQETQERYMEVAREQARLANEVKGLEQDELTESDALKEATTAILALRRYCSSEERVRAAERLSSLQKEKSSELAEQLRKTEELEERALAMEAALEAERVALEERKIRNHRSREGEMRLAQEKIKGIVSRRQHREEEFREQLQALADANRNMEGQVAELRARQFS